ncbi:MAG: LolA-like putative outer membrane lipoprotein chaperone [Bacteroidales bacterium]
MRNLILGIILLLSFSVTGQNREKAVAELEKCAAYFENNTGVEALFILREMEKGSKESHSFEGVLKSRGNKFYISTPDVDTWFDGKTQWSYVKGNEEVNVTDPTPEEVEAVNPVALLRLYKKGFKVSYKGEKNVGGKTGYDIEMIPSVKNAQWQQVNLVIDPVTHRPLSITLRQKGGSTHEITFLKITDKLNLKDTEFVFNKINFPAVEIIDLR